MWKQIRKIAYNVRQQEIINKVNAIKAKGGNLNPEEELYLEAFKDIEEYDWHRKHDIKGLLKQKFLPDEQAKHVMDGVYKQIEDNWKEYMWKQKMKDSEFADRWGKMMEEFSKELEEREIDWERDREYGEKLRKEFE
jgi:hypothetical protein